MKKTGRILKALIPAMAIMLLPAFAMHAKASNVSINESNFPDAQFRNYISEEFDSDGNGVIKDSEIAEITWISCDGKGIYDLKGIEYFTALEGLYCCNNRISSLDLSSNKSLEYLECYNNRLTGLNLSNNTSLKMLYCYDNQLTSLSLGNNTKLQYLHCANNYLGSLSLGSNTKLLYLDCSGNSLGSLDLSKNTKLETLVCENCGLTGLNLSKNIALMDIYCSSNQLTSLNVSKNTELNFLWCANNSLSSLDVSSNALLNYLSVEGNPMKRVEIYNNPYLLDTYFNGEKYTEEGITCHEGAAYLRYDAGDTVITEEPLKPMPFTLANEVDGIRITWEEVVDAAKYKIYKKDENGEWIRIRTTSALNYKDTSARAGYENVYTVQAFSADGKKLSTLGDGKGKVFLAPALSIVLSSKVGGVRINWEAVTDAVKYEVFRKNAEGSWDKIATTQSLQYTDKKAVYGESYYYIVRAVSAPGNYINKAGSGTKITYRVSAPVLSLRNIETGIEVSWKTMTNAAKYKVYRKDAGGKWTALATVREISYTDVTAENGKEYTYAVIGYDAGNHAMNNKEDGYSLVRNDAFVKTEAFGTAGGLLLTWSKFPGASKYRVYRKNASGKWVKLGAVTDLNYMDSEAEVKAENTYAVLAVTSGNVVISEYGNGNTVTYIIPPTAVGATTNANGVRLDWEPVIHAEKYKVFRRTKTTEWTCLKKTSGLKYTDSSAESGKNYYYTVVSVDSNGKALNEKGEGILVKYRAPKVEDFMETEELIGEGIEIEEIFDEGIEEEIIEEEGIEEAIEEEVIEEEVIEEEVIEEEVIEEETSEEEAIKEKITEVEEIVEKIIEESSEGEVIEEDTIEGEIIEE